MRLCPVSASVIVHYDNKKSLQDKSYTLKNLSLIIPMMVPPSYL